MELNSTQHKSFLWHLDIEPFTWKTYYGEQCPSFVTEENKEVWRRYLEKVIKKYLKAEVMNTPEFREIETMVNYEKLARIKSDEKRKRSMEKQRYRAKMERPRINYIPKGLSVDYEEEYSKYLMQEVSFVPRDNDDFMALLRLLERWHKKSIPQILEKNRPDAAYAIAITLCKHIPLLINRDDIQELVGRIQKTYRQTDIRQLSSPGRNCQDMEPRGETPGGMPLYQRDSRPIPKSSRHEEEVDGLDARDTI